MNKDKRSATAAALTRRPRIRTKDEQGQKKCIGCSNNKKAKDKDER